MNLYSGKLIIAGGGPSISETLPDIRRQRRISKQTKVIAVNRTHDWLLTKGLKPDFGVLIDPKPWVANYMTPTAGVKYMIGAKVDEATWGRFKGHPEVYHFHPLELAEERDSIIHGDDWMAIPGQSTVGLRSVPLGYCLGFRKFELHGLDCNKREKGHAYEKFTAAEKRDFNPEADLGYQIFYVKSGTHGTRFYEGTTHMARQLEEFMTMVSEFKTLESRGQDPCDIRVAGISAMGFLAALHGLHVNENYNAKPSDMPMTGTLSPSQIELEKDEGSIVMSPRLVDLGTVSCGLTLLPQSMVA